MDKTFVIGSMRWKGEPKAHLFVINFAGYILLILLAGHVATKPN